MPPKTSNGSIRQMRDAFVINYELRMAAVRKLDVPAANKHLLRAAAAARALAAIPEGRAEVEKLLAHRTLHIQLSAAEEIMGWNPDKVIPFLGSLLYTDLSEVMSPDERLDVRDRAKGWLYKHFDIRSFDRNDLIEPLRAYGVELPYEDHEKWR